MGRKIWGTSRQDSIIFAIVCRFLRPNLTGGGLAFVEFAVPILDMEPIVQKVLLD